LARRSKASPGVPWDSSVTDGLTDLIGGDLKNLEAQYKRTLDTIELLAKTFMQKSAKTQKTLAGMAATDIDSVLAGIEKSSERASKNVKEDWKGAWEFTSDGAKKTRKQVKEHFEGLEKDLESSSKKIKKKIGDALMPPPPDDPNNPFMLFFKKDDSLQKSIDAAIHGNRFSYVSQMGELQKSIDEAMYGGKSGPVSSISKQKQTWWQKALGIPTKTEVFQSQQQLDAVLDYREAVGKKAKGGETLQAIAGVGEELKDIATEFAGPLAVFGSFGTIFAKVVSQLVDMANYQGTIAAEFGGSEKTLTNYFGMTKAVALATRETEEATRKQGEAFKEHGISIENDNKALRDQLTLGGDLRHLYNLTADQVASLTKTYEYAGVEVKDLRGHFDTLSQAIINNRLSIEQGSKAIMEGRDLWQEFGGIMGTSQDKITTNLMGMVGLFKAFNMNTAEASETTRRMIGDFGYMAQQAALNSSLSGQDYYKVANQFMEGDPRGEIGRMKNALEMYQTLGGQFKTDEQVGGSQQDLYRFRQQNWNAARATSAAGFADINVSNLAAGYTAAHNKNKNLTPADWLNQQRKEQQAKVEAENGVMGKMIDALHNRPMDTATTVENVVENIFYFLSVQFMPLFKGLCHAVNQLANLPDLAEGAVTPGMTKKQQDDINEAAKGTAAPLLDLAKKWNKNKPTNPPGITRIHRPGLNPSDFLPPGADTVTYPILNPPINPDLTKLPPGSEVKATFGTLNPEQLTNALTIIATAKKAGASDTTIKSMLEGAMSESHLFSDPSKPHIGAHGERIKSLGNSDFGTSHGMFQAHKGGAWKAGITAQQLEDPSFITKLMLPDYMTHTKAGRTPGEIAGLSERPAESIRPTYIHNADTYYSKTADQLMALYQQQQLANQHLEKLVKVTETQHKETKLHRLTQNPEGASQHSLLVGTSS
jgi:hypothetical protein